MGRPAGLADFEALSVEVSVFDGLMADIAVGDEDDLLSSGGANEVLDANFSWSTFCEGKI